MGNISIHCLSEQDFSNIRDEWNELLQRSITNQFFLLWEWVYSWWTVFREKNKALYILIGRNSDNRIIGIAPLYIERISVLKIHSKKIIRFCSSVETYPDHLDIICENPYQNSFLEEMFNYLANNSGEWDEIRLEGIEEGSAIIRYLLDKAGSETQNRVIFNISYSSTCPYLSIQKSFKEYTESFSRSKRRTIFRYRKHLLERGDVEFKYAREDEIESGLKQLFALHGERVERRGNKSTFQNERVLMFHKNLSQRVVGSDSNKILISTINLNSIPIASLYCFKHSSKYYCYQSGLSCEGEKNSAGTVILSLNIEKAFNDGCNEVDFLRGNERYKYFWTKEYRRNMLVVAKKNDIIGRSSAIASKLYLSIEGLIKTAIRSPWSKCNSKMGES